MATYTLECPKCKKRRPYKPFAGILPKSKSRILCPFCKKTMGIKNNIVEEFY